MRTIFRYFILSAFCFIFFIFIYGCGKRLDPYLPLPEVQAPVTEDQGEGQESVKSGKKDEVPDERKEKEIIAVVRPDAPLFLVGVYTGKSIVLTWKEVLEQGVTSYRVYRSAGSGYELVGETVTPAFVDGDIQPALPYYYKVTAVGQSESPLSEELKVSVEIE